MHVIAASNSTISTVSCLGCVSYPVTSGWIVHRAGFIYWCWCGLLADVASARALFGELHISSLAFML